jgi:Uma2 family endonuclease
MADAAYEYEGTFTYRDYKTWELKPGERFELIDGIAYAMSAPNTAHQLLVIALGAEIHTFLKGKPCKVIASPFDVRLFYEEDESDDTVVQPDLVVICDPEKLGVEGCRGAPDVAIEILSPSNTAIEMERKLILYQDAEVKEYWVVDPKNKNIRVYSLKDGEYSMRRYHAQDTSPSGALPGLEISLPVVFEGL